MINILQLDYVPSAVAWIHRAGAAVPELAVADSASPTVRVYDGRGLSQPLHTLDKIHMRPVRLMLYCPMYDIVISCDEAAMVEYWSGCANDYGFPKAVRQMKTTTPFRHQTIKKKQGCGSGLT
jgi:peptidylprolyl isomerase domain and WD repeat-containing protein 1